MEEKDFTEMIARLEEEAMVPTTKSRYRSLAHISPTSVVIERLLRRVKTHYDPSSSPHGSKHTRDVTIHFSATTRIYRTGPLHS